MKISLAILAGLLFFEKTQAHSLYDSPSSTDTTNLQTVLIEENRLSVKFDKQNRNIQIVDKAQIEKIPGKSLNEILGHIPGLDLRQRGAFGAQADISIDGGTFEQTLVLINGVKIIDMQTSHNVLNLPFPVDAIERIEVLRGPAARIFGINSLTGAINIVTKKPLDNTIQAHVYAGSGFKNEKMSNDADAKEELLWGKGAQIGFQTHKNGFKNSIYGSHESGNGYRYNTAFKNQKVWMDGSQNFKQKHEIAWMGGYVDNDFGANGFYAAPGDVESQEIVQTAIASLQYKNWVNSKFSWSPRISYRYAYDDYRYFRNDLKRARSQHYSHALTAELNSQYQTHFGAFGFGIEARQEKINSSNIQNHERENYGGFAEFRTDQIPRTQVSAGAYVNYNTDYGWQIFPGIDLGYALTSKWRVVAHTGMGQRIPSFTDLYLNQRPGNMGNPDLVSEVAWNTEGGFKYFGKNGHFQTLYFYRNIQNFIDWVRDSTTEPWQPANFQNNETQGITISGLYNFQPKETTSQWSIGGGYTYLKPTIHDPQHITLRSKYGLQTLKHQLQFQGGYQFKSFHIASTVRYQERLSQNDYWIWDARIAYQLKEASLYLDLQNIVDVTYIEAESVPMPGRWASLGFKYRIKL